MPESSIYESDETFATVDQRVAHYKASMSQIPLDPTYPAQDVRVKLGEKTYRLQFIWNRRQALWSMNISTDNGTLLLSGVPLHPDSIPLQPFSNSKLPPGQIIVWDTGDPEKTPGRYEFGTQNRVRILYYGPNV
ncbi:MAG TPA: hypothetical protein PKW95_20550 [bacterium]|nr:hypothetical protein [bacterium]